MEQARLHEVHAEARDWAAALAFAFGALDPESRGPILLVRLARRAGMVPCGEGLAGLGIDPARLVIVTVEDNFGLLRAGLDAARCPGLAAVVMESWGAFSEYDLTAGRRLVLAAESSGVPVVVLRGEAAPRSGAAHTRWLVRAVPSVPQMARAPGPVAVEAELQRQRGGPGGLRWWLEWDEEDGRFRKPEAAPLSGAVVPGPFVRTGEARRRAVA